MNQNCNLEIKIGPCLSLKRGEIILTKLHHLQWTIEMTESDIIIRCDAEILRI
jgi:hypothetical protein